MPIYDYKCTTCGERLEVEQSITDNTLTAAPGCPEGGDHTLKKVFHPVGIAFKGDGFYKNDARGSAKKSSSDTSSGSDTSTDSSTTSSADSSTKSSSDASSSSSSTSSTATKSAD